MVRVHPGQQRGYMSPRRSIEERLYSKIHFPSDEDGCWEWVGAKDLTGYGRIKVNRKVEMAHRVSYSVFVGEIPEGHDIDHECCNPPCVRPDHLQPATRSENTRRGYGPNIAAAYQRSKDKCPAGHAYSEDNTYTDKNGYRRCNTCHRMNQRKYDARARASKR